MSSADEIGRLAWMTPQSQAAALAAADASRPFDLAVDYFMGMPAWTVLGDPKYDIWLTHTPQGEGRDYAGTAISMYSHVGTHICSLNHLGRDGRFWNGWTAEEHLGSRAWRVGGVYPPIIAPGMLLDVAGVHGTDCLPDSYAITPEDLTAAGAAELRAWRRRAGPHGPDVALARPRRLHERSPGRGHGRGADAGRGGRRDVHRRRLWRRAVAGGGSRCVPPRALLPAGGHGRPGDREPVARGPGAGRAPSLHRCWRSR